MLMLMIKLYFAHIRGGENHPRMPVRIGSVKNKSPNYRKNLDVRKSKAVKWI